MKFIREHKHCWLFITFLLLYLCIFGYVENRGGVFIHIISCGLDKIIPFCEYFIIPYYLWFAYIAVAFLYFGFFSKDRSESYRLIITLTIGMTVFLIISLIYPNGHDLRPTTFARDNIFVDLIRILHKMDTATNIFPSIHVFNSVAVGIAIARDSVLRQKPVLIHSSNVLVILIICSTVFLKQHSIIDVIGGLALNAACYHWIYSPKYARERKRIPEIL